MKIGKISISNVKNIDELELSLIDENTGTPHNVILLVGENGTGKTTVLESIVSCFTINRRIYEGKILSNDDVRKKEPSATIFLDLNFNSDEAKQFDSEKSMRILQSIVKGDASYNGQLLRIGNSPYISNRNGITLSKVLKFGREPITVGNVLYFDANRIVSNEKIKGPNNEIPSSSFQRSLMSTLNVKTRFQYTKQWLVNLDYKEAKLYREKDEDSGLLNKAVEAFNLLLAPYSFSRISQKSEILFNTPYGEIELDSLSDGMKSVFALIGEILFRFSLPYMDEDEIDIDEVLNTEAVILIDEIDCHLHPKWQLNIIPAMRSLFPSAQFIMTTHSPLIVKSVNPNEVIKLGGEI